MGEPVDVREIIARAIHDAAWTGDMLRIQWEERTDQEQSPYLHRADAILAAFDDAGIQLIWEGSNGIPSKD